MQRGAPDIVVHSLSLQANPLLFHTFTKGSLVVIEDLWSRWRQVQDTVKAKICKSHLHHFFDFCKRLIFLLSQVVVDVVIINSPFQIDGSYAAETNQHWALRVQTATWPLCSDQSWSRFTSTAHSPGCTGCSYTYGIYRPTAVRSAKVCAHSSNTGKH